MKYAVVYHVSILDGTVQTEVWDAYTVALADRYAPGWEVESRHASREEAQASMVFSYE